MNCTENNAIFVTDNLRRLNSTKNNIIEAKKLGRGTVSEGNTYLNRTGVAATSAQGDRFVQVEPSPLRMFAFFEPATVGLSCTMVDGDARLDKLLAAKPFAKAGLRTGDLVLAIDRVKFTTEAEFRTLLRRRMVVAEPVFKIQRGDRVLQVPVRLSP